MTYIRTYTDRAVDFLEPRLETINITDIAHALAITNRFSGHTMFPYSVAQHSVLAAVAAPFSLQLEALLHDAHEAYVGDMPTPLKHLMPEYQELEGRMELAVRTKFGLPWNMSPEVKHIDRRMLATEAEHFGFSLWTDIGTVVPFHAMKIEEWDWTRARDEFIERFNVYTSR